MSKPSEDVSEVLHGQSLALDHSPVASRSVVLFLKEKKKNPRPTTDIAFREISDFVEILVLYFILIKDFLLLVFFPKSVQCRQSGGKLSHSHEHSGGAHFKLGKAASISCWTFSQTICSCSGVAINVLVKFI